MDGLLKSITSTGDVIRRVIVQFKARRYDDPVLDSWD